MLKKRFPRIVKLNKKTSEKKVLIVMAACALHNICIKENDNINFFLTNAEQVSYLFPTQKIIHYDIMLISFERIS